jgi:preprotein translocase subunit SecD
LPLGLELIQERNVDALLGEDSLRRSLVAGSIGMVILLVFMAFYYRIPGVVSALALFSYAIILLSIFKILPVVLTLSGAAAVILSLGFAVDANVLIAERTKEELRAGRGLLAAINTGFDRAWPSIRDGNLSTIIVASVLFWFGDRFGTSIMQGFALTLVIGVMLSMFTAFFASRVFLRSIALTPIGKKTGLFMPVSDEIENSGRS